MRKFEVSYTSCLLVSPIKEWIKISMREIQLNWLLIWFI